MNSESLINIIRRGKSNVDIIYNKSRQNFQSKTAANSDNKVLNTYLKSEQKLSADEKDLIKQKYDKAIPHIARGYKFFQAMKYLDHFDPNYIPTAYYYPYILKNLILLD